MAPTFQTALFFTIVGLSFAASSARQVRWCTISALEQKKCNDLVGSCHVSDISLVCVQRSSTESCMAAIKNRQADAMFLDSGDVYKASTDRYNLKPANAEPYYPEKAVTKCLKEQKEALSGDGILIGLYIPQCDEKGDYYEVQCRGSDGLCWCVNAIGEKIDGTDTLPGGKPPVCLKQGLTTCLKERQEALGGSEIVKGRFVPQCDEKGNYHPKQCHDSTGYCWCVNAKGVKIEGTNTPPGNAAPTCPSHESTKCLKERQEALGGSEMSLGRFVPQCDEKGNYHPKQCHDSTGYCWCVNANGEKIEGTNTPPGNAAPTCQSHDLTKCLKERQEALGGRKVPKGRFVPQCDEKGNYHPKQCHDSTGYCWCVNANGEKIEGTNTPPGNAAPTCQSHESTKCLKERQEALEGSEMSIGRFVPQCDEKGNYHPKQCHGSTGYCWCVNANGEKIEGTNTPPGNAAPTCQSHALTKCLKERQEALGGSQIMRGRFVPRCDEKGNYHPKQCHGSTGYCWCVNANGEKIEGTNTPPGNAAPTCQSHDLTKCLKERQEALGGIEMSIGRFVPQCDEKGNYHPKQCHGSTGYCWCVNANGEKIEGTNTPPGNAAPTCQSHDLTKCLKERQVALGGRKVPIGRFVPQCDEKGNYHPKQCHDSTGYCWCVNANGEKIEGTNTPPGNAAPSCESHDLTKCLKERQEALGGSEMSIGRFVPQCDEKGNYHPKQCHGSTGYCWCVNANGEKIEGTNTPPGNAAPTCQSHDLTKCLKERQVALGGRKVPIGRFVPQCDEKGNYHPKQCHDSTGYCWCVNANGEKIEGTNTPPGNAAPTCQSHDLTKCLKERQEALGGSEMSIGRFVPQCDEKGNYHPKQCHGSTGYCWCVNANGEKIEGTNTPPGNAAPTCQSHDLTKCLKERQVALGGRKVPIGRFVPQCDEKGNYHPKQCHGSTGYCWCVNANGEKIEGTNTPPGNAAPTCQSHDQDTDHYAVVVVKKSSNFQFDGLKGKRSCHSGISKTGGWKSPVTFLLEKKLLPWDGPKKESVEKAVSKFFSACCIPGATEPTLCKQCKGEGVKKCKSSHDEPYYGDHGALRCLKEDNGDVAFLKNTALSVENSDMYELLCPDNTRRPLNKYRECNLGKVPADAVVTRKAGDKTKDINEFLMEAQKKQCKLFSSPHGKDLMFDDSTTHLAPLPSQIDAFFFLGVKWHNAMKALTEDVQLPSKNKVRWCAISKAEKAKCDDWEAVSGGAITCTEESSQEKCIIKILKGEADVVTLDIQHMYTALMCGLLPAIEEYHNKDDLLPCQVIGAPYNDFGQKRVVALVKKSNKDINWNNLRGKKSCHTHVGDLAGWDIPSRLISLQNNNISLESFFGESCAPGSDPNSKLCKLCIGDPKNTKANTRCSLSNKEAYHGNMGAFRCLVEKGDVAFLPHTVVFQNTDGKNPAEWAKDLKSENFELLCLDGSRAPVTNYRECNLLGLFHGTQVTRKESISDVVRIVANQQSLFGKNAFEKDMFQMFSSKNGQNLLFSDDTQCLIPFDEQPIDIMVDFFGARYFTVMYGASRSAVPSELIPACTYQHRGNK